MTLPQLLSHLAALPQWLEEPPSHSARVAGSATQPLGQSSWSSHSATLPEWLEQPLNHSATQSGSARVGGAATQPLSQSGWTNHSGTSHSARLSHSVSGWVAEWLRQPLWQSGWGENFRHCALSRINTLKTQLSKPAKRDCQKWYLTFF